jgi:energy-coupling factor transporter ATP-binding protein EcfA2
MAAEIRERRIATVARSLAIEALLDKRIGSPDRTAVSLSGGERRRVGLAHELIMRPEVLCLDEPTSGLSADDAEQVVSQLRKLADSGITVAVTIHQPPPRVFAQFQHLILMAGEGRVVYCGPRVEAVTVVERATGTPLSVAQGENAADYLIRQAALHPDEIFRGYQQCDAALGRDGGDLSEIQPNDKRGGCGSQTRAPLGSARECQTSWRDHLRIFQTLMARSRRVFAQDSTNLRIAAWQIPAIVLLILLAFHGFQTDSPEDRRLNQALVDVTTSVAPYLQEQKPVPLEATIQEVAARADLPSHGMSEVEARLRGAVVFTLVAAAFWIGLLGACREMVLDKHLLRHECRTCASIRSVLWAKLAWMGLLALPQCAILVAATAPFLLQTSIANILGLAGALWLTCVAAAGLGLLAAALAPSARAALTAVPLIMVPQLLFAGMLRPEAALASGDIVSKWLGYFSLQRWGFDLALGSVPGQVQSVSLVQGVSPRIVDVIAHLKLTNRTVVDCFFPGHFWWAPPAMLLGATVLSLLLAEWHLRRKFYL